MSRLVAAFLFSWVLAGRLPAQALRDARRLCDSLYTVAEFKAALPVAQRCLKLAIEEKPDRRDSILASMHLRLSNIQYRLGQSEPAAANAQTCIEIRREVYGAVSPEVATAMHSLGNAVFQQGRLLDAQKIFLASLAMRDSVRQPPSRLHAASLNSLGMIAGDLGNLHEAEDYFTRAADLMRAKYGEKSRDFALPLGNIAQVNVELGNYERGLALHRKSLIIRREVYGDDHPMYASALVALADLYKRTEHWAESEPLLRQALAIRRNKPGPTHQETLKTEAALAEALLEAGRADSARILMLDAVAHFDTIHDGSPADRGDLHNGLADIFLRQNRPDLAQNRFREAYLIEKKSLPDAQVEYLRSLEGLAFSSMLLGQAAAADSFFCEAQQLELKKLALQFPHFSDRERQLFFRPVAQEIERFATFAEQSAGELPSLSGQLLDLRLATRGILFSASKKMQEQFRQTGNLADYEVWRQASERLAELFFSPPEKHENLGLTIAELTETVRSLEKKLGRQSASFSEQTAAAPVDWRQLRDALKPDEAAVEIVRFHRQTAAGEGEVCYLALVVTRETTAQPGIIVLNSGDGRELETVILEFYKVEMGMREGPLGPRGTPAFRGFWQPIEPFLKGKKRLYFTLDGAFHKVNLGTLRSADGRFLSEKYEFRYLTNLSDLARERQKGKPKGEVEKPFLPKTALLVGDPRFDFFDSNLAARGIPPASIEGLGGELRGIDLRPISGSGSEVWEVAGLLKEKGCAATVVTQKEATEGVVKAAGPVSVMHLATHGFFLEDLSGKSLFDTSFAPRSPMLRSMLFFAGSANRLLGGIPNPAADGQDGILTALEVQDMMLDSTELVTLSACQTGLGDVVGGEGVYGLQRAFRVAGARALLMSLWNVDDEATRFLMNAFYQNWLGGMSKADALRAAEAATRTRFPEPEKWGGFVLIGN